MKVDLSVFDPNEDREISFHDYQFTHIGCGAMSNKYITAHEEYALRCGCGLEIHIHRFSSAVTTVAYVTTDHQPRELDPDSFHSNMANAIAVHAQRAT